jgi:hypothetical protein
MKKVVIPVVLASILVLALLPSGCGESAAGEVITEKKDFTNFNYVEVGGAFEVDITRADTYSITISADESLFDYVDVTKTGTTLKIYLSPHHVFTDFTLGNKVLKAEITMPNLYGLDISGASEGTVIGFQTSVAFGLIVSGASSLRMSNMEVGDINAGVSGASRVSGNITTDDARLEVSGASSLELGGSADMANLIVSGASRADLTDFTLRNASVVLSGASEATVNVEQRLDINVSGASRFYFVGNPTLGSTIVSGASTIKHK